MLAVALHGQLLEIGGESFQVLLVRQYGDRLGAEEIVVPDAQKPHQHRQVALERGGAEVLVHLVKAVEHGAELVRADGQHGGKANRRIHGIAPAHPIPEAEHVGGIDPELRHFRLVRRHRHKVLGHRLLIPPKPCSDQARAV